MARHDILVVTDPRFSGGTSAALISDVEAFSALGLHVGLLPIRSHFFTGAGDRENPAVLTLPDLPGVDRVTGAAKADLAFLHHPLAFFHGVKERIWIEARRALVVAHHPPFRGDGSLEYSPIATGRRIREAFGISPWWAPVSGVVRAQLRSFSPFLTLTSEDWVNGFDTSAWAAARPVFADGSAIVGRHGRADLLKWPATRADIIASLAPGPSWRTRVMGCPEDLLHGLGVDTHAWEILAFNDMPVRAFLDGLDVFAFFYHPRWVEAFGRTVAEAILMERPAILDPRLEPTFGDLGQYCRPAEAPVLMDRLRADPKAARAEAAARRMKALSRFGTDGTGRRLEALARDRGTRSRSGPKAASAPVALRKLIGLTRRRLAAGGA